MQKIDIHIFFIELIFQLSFPFQNVNYHSVTCSTYAHTSAALPFSLNAYIAIQLDYYYY